MELIDGCLFEEYFNQWVQVKDNTFGHEGAAVLLPGFVIKW